MLPFEYSQEVIVMPNYELLAQQDINQKLDEIEDDQLQKMIEKMILLYVSRVQYDNDYQKTNKMMPLSSEHQLTQTDTAIFVDQLLKVMEIEVFELQMWRSMK
jgi:hypothetical protein